MGGPIFIRTIKITEILYTISMYIYIYINKELESMFEERKLVVRDGENKGRETC